MVTIRNRLFLIASLLMAVTVVVWLVNYPPAPIDDAIHLSGHPGVFAGFNAVNKSAMESIRSNYFSCFFKSTEGDAFFQATCPVGGHLYLGFYSAIAFAVAGFVIGGVGSKREE